MEMQNKFKCKKLLCLQCLINKGYNKYYMLNCTRHWYCNECLHNNFKERQENEKQQLQQHQHTKHKKKYGIAKHQNKLNCNLSCYKRDAVYSTQRGLQIHSIQYGWQTHQHNKQHHSHSTSSYTAADVQWISSNNSSNLCSICLAETNNDPNKSIEKLEIDG